VTSLRTNYGLSAKLVPTFADIGCRVDGATDTPGRIIGFLDQSRYIFFQVAPQLHSRGRVYRRTTSQKIWHRARTSGSSVH
jgi:hypothetical protein